MQFQQQREAIEHDIIAIQDRIDRHKQKQAAEETVANNERGEIAKLHSELAKAAFLAIAVDDRPADETAWEYLRAKVDCSPEAWQVIQERLPKLMALQGKEKELYLYINSYVHGDWGNQVNNVTLFSLADMNINVAHNTLIINSTRIGSADIIPALAYPTESRSWKEPFINQYGAAIGNEEIEQFLERILEDPMYETLSYLIALEICDQPQARHLWQDFSISAKSRCVTTAVEFMRYFPHGHHDKYSAEVEEFRKAYKLLAFSQGGIIDNREIDYALWNEEEGLVRAAIEEWLGQNEQVDKEAYTILRDALSHYWHAIRLNFRSADF